MTTPTRLGKYDLVARIGKGGMAEIYLARQRGAGFSRLVVIKRILPHLAEEPHFVRMFLEEARLAALIAHPNVVQIYDVDQDQGAYYIAMEYIDGPSLGLVMRKLRRAGGAVPYPVASEVIAQACDGLHAAHELRDDNGELLQLVHRDVSPHNLMVNESGTVKLVDFGIAKAHGSTVQTRTGSVKGKYPYMSPEQCRGEPLDRRADIFSLGAVFIELLSGRRVFQRQTDLMTLKAVTEEPLPHARDLRPTIPEEISRIVDRCLERDKEHRFATAAELGRAVRSVIAALGEGSGPAVLASYLAAEHHELLLTRAEALRQASALRPGSGSLPIVDGLGSGSGSATEKPTLSVPPGARATPRRTALWALLGALTVGLATGGGLLYRFLGPGRRPSGPALRLALPPSFPAAIAQKEMQGLVRYLERKLSRPVDLVVAPNYNALRTGLLDGTYHVANLPPLEYVLARHANPRIRALVTNLYEGARSYQALLVALDGSYLTDPSALRGKRICYVDRESTSGYLLARDFLRSKNLDPDKLFSSSRFSGNHAAVINDLLEGHCDVGAIYSNALAGVALQGVPTSRVRIVAVTGQLPFDVLCAAPDLPSELWQVLNQALLELDPARDLGQPIVGPVFRISGFTTARPEDFADVERAARGEGLIK
jgi:phosphate/phosphite/phosphonate ABC transporter binding protein